MNADQNVQASDVADTGVNKGSVSERGLKRKLQDDDDSSKNYPPALKRMFGPLTCDLCKVTANSTLSAYTHYKGKSHKKKVNKYLQDNNIPLDSLNKKSNTEFKPSSCEICNVFLTSELQSLQHYSGKNHKKKVAAHKEGNVKVKVERDSVDPTGRFGIGKSFAPQIEIKEAEKPKPSGDNVHFCTVCSIFTTSAEALALHRMGSKHKKKLELEKAAELNSLAKYRTPSDFYYCPNCDISANSADQFLFHIKNKRHINNMKKKGSV